MLALAAFVTAMVLGGHAISEYLWARERGRPRSLGALSVLERVLSTATCTLALVLAVDWTLGYVHLLRRGPLLAAALAAGGLGALCVARARRAHPTDPPRRTLLVVALCAPPVIWALFVMWRASILPVLSHDALNYHLPKAVMMMRAAGVGYFADASNPRIYTYPNDYEMLLTDVLVLTRSDALDGVAQRPVLPTAVRGLGDPGGALLGRGAHVFAAGLLAGGHADRAVSCRSTQERPDVRVSGARNGPLGSQVDRVGRARGRLAVPGEHDRRGWDEVHGPVRRGRHDRGPGRCADRAARRLRAPAIAEEVAALAGVLLAGFFLLGGETYLENLRHAHFIDGLTGEGVLHSGYGRWSQVWQFPGVLPHVPFSGSPDAVWVPWRNEYWWWPSRDFYFSHYGIAVTLATLASFACVLRYRAADGGTSRPLERRIASAILAGSFLVFLPTYGGPAGMFSCYPRYLVFIVPLVACWSVAPLAREVD